MPLQPGDIIGEHYRIEAEIGRGSFGRVYRAKDTNLNRDVAIKELLKKGGDVGSSDYTNFVDRFRREAQLQASFNHPHIAQVYHLQEDLSGQETPDQMYLIMEYVEGGSLRDYLNEKRQLPPHQAIKITQQLLQALTRVHTDRSDIVHRDIKPSNILLTSGGDTKLSDFGLAQIGGDSMRSLSTNRNQPGTPLYMSPEQEKGAGYLYPASDLFAVGCVLFEMLTGEIYKQALKDKKKMKALWSAIPAHLRPILKKSLSNEPDDRFANAADFADALDKASQFRQRAKTAVLSTLIFLLLFMLGGGVWGVVVRNTPSVNWPTSDPTMAAIGTLPPDATWTSQPIMTPSMTPTAFFTNTPARASATARPTHAATHTPRPKTSATQTQRPATQTATAIATSRVSVTLPPATNTSPPPATNTSPPPATNTSPPPATNTSLPPTTNTSPPPATNTSSPPATNTSPPPATETPSTGVTRPPTPEP